MGETGIGAQALDSSLGQAGMDGHEVDPVFGVNADDIEKIIGKIMQIGVLIAAAVIVIAASGH